MKIALNMICAPTNAEAKVLKRCLTSIAPYVDGIYVTITGKNKMCEDVVKAFGGVVSTCKWENDFAKARNFALSQVPKEYDYWMWLDADDVIRDADKIRPLMEDHPSVDVFVFNYLYAFDEWDNPVIVHMKSRILRNDGCVEWRGKLHEDFHNSRQLESKFVDGVDILHLSDEERFEKAKKRNIKVAQKAVEGAQDDPRTYWNLGNALKGDNHLEDALKAFDSFMALSKSDEEKYIVCQRVAEIYFEQEKYEEALEAVRYAIGLRPNYPDAYILGGRIFFALKRWEEAKEFVMTGLQKPVPYHEIIVFNPRDYDLEPLRLLAKIYFNLSLPNLALECLEACYKITPKDESLGKLIKDITVESDRVEKVLEQVEKLKEIKDDKELEAELAKLPEDLRSHPHICHLRNTRLIKKHSSGKDVVFFCSYTDDVWTPQTALEKGIGGSEEAVINLSKELVKHGWNVTVYNNCGYKDLEFDGVKYRPYWAWNPRDKQDVTILWRTPRFLDYEINSKRIFLDMHDVIPSGEFNEKRIAKVDGIFFKSKTHRELFPQVPNDKSIIIPNGIHWQQFQENIEKDPYLLINTSSPDRSLKTLVKAFKRVKEQVPKAKLKWAYGWNVWDANFGGDAERIKWKKEVMEEAEEANVEILGRIGHTAIAKLYQEASIFAYPTAFLEIDCISARKAQAAGAFPISTDFGALKETIQFGEKIKTNIEKENWDTEEFDFGLQEERAVDEWVKNVVQYLKERPDETEMREWTKQFDWVEIGNKWNIEICKKSPNIIL